MKATDGEGGMYELVELLFEDIRNHCDFDHAEFIDKGFSSAQKYILYKSGEAAYLLRVYDGASYSRRVEEQKYLQQHYDNGVMCQKPVHEGYVPELGLCFLVLNYMDGESGEEVLPKLTVEQQVEQGYAAGHELRKIHEITPETPFNWAEKRYTKYMNKKNKVAELGVCFDKQKEIEMFIEAHFDLLKESRVSFQHDDFHPSNLIFKDNRLIGVIDFSRFDWGDPWEEFFKLSKYTCEISNHFAWGQLMGYFNERIPDHFWLKYHLFVALNQHATLIGGFQNHRFKDTLLKISQTIDSHDFAGCGPPKWFLESSSR
ncbi:aminoglycoside phosphotransferase family protein [Paenibacillus sp. UNC451MF]|uniref:aminoglycoside phosphotransferase family protein n=1 Tax=Paenibacillus sp. UNC451MF TaxID=1449063 RepID=UPI00068EB5D9|nr:aminoglycoside phosphotransferase family protein [Paenibacillus sp. UNC451MF]